MTTSFAPGFSVHFNGAPGRRYGLQRTLTLEEGSWEEVAATGPLPGYGQVTLTDPQNPRPVKAFYRIAISKP